MRKIRGGLHRASRPLLKTKTMLVVADCPQAVVLKTFLKTIETIETIFFVVEKPLFVIEKL